MPMKSTLLILALLGSAADAQSADPARRAHHSLAYDDVRERVILTGGSTPHDGGSRFEFFNDLWEFDGAKWTQRASSGDKLSGVALAFDTRRGRLLSFGGYQGRSVGSVRLLEGDSWRALGDHPEIAAAEPGLVYDATRDRFVAFGGSAGMGRAHGDTWEFDGSAWAKVATTGPAARQAHAMVFDSKRNRTVLFGGMGSSSAPGQRPPLLGDTWELDGKSWKQIPLEGPSPRNSPGVAYDSRRGRVILFGGSDSTGFKGDTWAYDGTAWTKLADNGPEPRVMGYLAYDRKRDRIVLFGGRKGWPDGDLNDTWEFDGTSWRKVSPP
jgi:hypothetical protein